MGGRPCRAVVLGDVERVAVGVLPESDDTGSPSGAASRLTAPWEEESGPAPAWRDVRLIGYLLQVRAVWRCFHEGCRADHRRADVPLLLRQVVVGDGRRPARTPLAQAQEEAGVPAGRWMGRRLAALGLAAGDVVTEAQLHNPFGEGWHPRADQIEVTDCKPVPPQTASVHL